MTNALLIRPNGQPLLTQEQVNKDTINDGRARRLNIMGGPYVVGGNDLKGATPNPRRADWKLYWEMYVGHSIVKSAIDKKVKVCTNTGFDFVPRDSRSQTNDSEVDKAREFFKKQPDFIGELRRVYRDLEIFGDGYLYVVPDRRRRPVKLKRIAPWTMNIKAKSNGDVIEYVQKDPSDSTSKAVSFRPHEILHFRYDNPIDDLYGLSPLESLKADITADLYAATYNMNFFKNGAATGIIMVVKDASVDEMERNKQWLLDEYVGQDNQHKPIILAGDVELKHAVQSHVEMGFLAGREDIKKRILYALDVPPAKIGDIDDANRSNSKEQDKSFRAESVKPTQYIVEAVINDQFMQTILGIHDTIFVHSEADIRDAQEQMDLWDKATKGGILTINEVRAKMGLPPIDGGDIAFILSPTGAVPVVDLELYFKLSQPNTQGKGAIPEDAHEGHGHAEGSDSLVGPEPKPSANTETGLAPTSRSHTTLLDLVKLLEQSPMNDKLLRQVYTHACSSPNPYMKSAADDIRTSLCTTDDILKLAHVEKAQAALMFGLMEAA